MKIDRLIGILSILLQKEKVTATWLAEKFEVSRRTINRDIEALCKAGIPLTTAQGRGGGISVMEDYRLDRTLLTSADMQAILTGLKSLDSISQTNRYRQLMDKLHIEASPLMPAGSHILINLVSWYRSSLPPKIELIREAAECHEIIRFTYFSPGRETQREIEPYLLVFQWSAWYVWGYCLSRQDYRLFKLNRIQSLTRTGQCFVPRETPEYDASPDKAFPNTLTASVRFKPTAKWRLVEEYGLDSFSEEPDGTLLFSGSFFDRESLFVWLLGFGEQAELLTPEPLRAEFLSLLKRTAEPYLPQKPYQ